MDADNTAGGQAGNDAQDGAEVTQTETAAAIYKQFATQQDYDNEAAKIRGAAERNAKREFMKSLGLKPDDDARLTEIKEAWDKSLTMADKAERDAATLKAEVADLKAQLDEKNYVIAAMSAISGASIGDIGDIVKMARGLTSDGITPEEAIRKVMALVKPTAAAAAAPPKPIPQGVNIVQPDQAPIPETNPWKAESYNLTDQSRIFMQDPNKADRLAREAGAPPPRRLINKA